MRSPAQPSHVFRGRLDISRYMGDWYVIAHIPTWPERKAFHSIESYRLNADSTVAIVNTFRVGAADGPLRTLRDTGFITNRTNSAEWKVMFLWPLKADYLVVDVDSEYRWAVVGVPSKKWVWIMTRTKTLDPERYEQLVERIKTIGYPIERLRRVPQE